VIRWLTSWLFSGPTEIQKTEMALMRHRRKVDDMDRYWAERNGVCCPNCMFGSEYTEAIDKIERTEAWLKILKGKKNGNLY
jgi:hypothetical protein